MASRKRGEPRLLERRIVIIVEIVDADDFLAAREQARWRSDEPMKPAAPVTRMVMAAC